MIRSSVLGWFTDTVLSIFWYAIPIASLTFRCEVWLMRFQNASSVSTVAFSQAWSFSSMRDHGGRRLPGLREQVHREEIRLLLLAAAPGGQHQLVGGVGGELHLLDVRASPLATVLRPLSAALAPTPISNRACPFFCMSPSTSEV